MTGPDRPSSRLHHALLTSLLDRGNVPTAAELGERLDWSPEEVDRAFDELAEEHGVVLHPKSRVVRVVHPFSVAPTPFLVEARDRRWWGPCAWCALGIAALVDEPCTVTTTLGGGSERVRLTVADGRLDRDDLVVHFPIPMRRAWEDVLYTCSTMLLFRDANQVDAWCERSGVPRGDIQPVARVSELARRWYGGHLDPEWRKKSATEARRIFAELGLTHPVWDLPAGSGRF